MAARDLPDDRATLEYLNQSADRLLAVLEPVRQQVNYATEFAADMLEGNFTEADFFGIAFGGLQQNVAGGIPPHQALADYLDLDALAPPSQIPEQELERLNRLVGSGTASAADRERHAILAGVRIAEYRDAIGVFVDRVHDLQRRIIDKLGGPKAPTPSADREEGVEEQETATPRTEKVKKPRRKAPASRAEARFDQWGVGIDAHQRWQVFQRFGTEWRHQKVMEPQPTAGYQAAILKAFINKHRTLDRTELVRAVRGNPSDYEGKKLYKSSLISAMSRLRTCLRTALGFPPRSRPITWQKSMGAFCLLIQVGYARLEEGRMVFETADDQ
jgi:hypothetical protein